MEVKKNRITQPHPVSVWFYKWRLVMPLISLAIIASGTYLAIKYGQGYRPTTKGLTGTGLLAANSFPPGAEVYLNGKLTTATDDAVNLTPGEYLVDIKKDGYLPWQKKLWLNKELVTQTNAALFKSVASMTPLTLTGAVNVTPSPDGTKLAYIVATASASAKNGLYIADLVNGLLSLQRGARQITKNPKQFDLTKADLLWSPNSAQILVHAEVKGIQFNYLIEADRLNDIETLSDVTARLNILLSQWEEDISLRENKQLALLPGELQQIATKSATNVYFSPNEDRVMYTSLGYAVIPEGLLSKPPSPNTQPEVRKLEPNHLYVYDLTEDKNYDLGNIPIPVSATNKVLLTPNLYQQSSNLTASISGTQASIPLLAYKKLQDAKSFKQTLINFSVHYSSINVDGFQWYPNSTHILITKPDRVEVVEFDATNRQTIYSGPFMNGFVYPWPDGSKLVILTNLNPLVYSQANLYTVDIR